MELNKKYPFFYLVNKKAALAMIGNELIDILKKFFGGCIRSYNFYSFRPLIYLFKGDELVPWTKEKDFGMFYTIINQFHMIGGF